MGESGQKGNCAILSLTRVGWDVQIFQTSLIKVDTNVYWNGIADIKSTEISMLLKEIKATDND